MNFDPVINSHSLRWLAGALFLLVASDASGADSIKRPHRTVSEILGATTADDWRSLDPENTLYLELPAGRVIIEVAPDFAPSHVANVKALVREKYFDGLAIVRVQDNYVVQWADPEAEKLDRARPIRTAKRTLPPEFDRSFDRKIPFTPLTDGDVYVREVGFSAAGFPVARDRSRGKMWLIHSYGMVGAGRDNAPDSGGGAELYAVIGQAPRHLDRNVTLFGRVVMGMELLSALPRGSGAMGFYAKPEQRIPIKEMRVASDVAPDQRSVVEILRTDTRTFQAYLEARRNRREEWFINRANHIDISNIPIPARARSSGLSR